MKHGLILEGGALRGLFTAGVLDVFMEAGLVFDGAIGVSAGAAFGCNYKSRQPGRVIRYNRRFAAVYRALATRHEWYNAALRRIDERVARGKAFLICPESVLPISRVCHDPETMQKVYDIGRATAKRLLPQVCRFMA